MRWWLVSSEDVEEEKLREERKRQWWLVFSEDVELLLEMIVEWTGAIPQVPRRFHSTTEEQPDYISTQRCLAILSTSRRPALP